jgi:hypothetical protein
MSARITALAGIVFLTAGLYACGDDLFNLRWVQNPDTAVLYSLSRPELNLPSAFNFIGRASVRVESPTATGRWDVALDTMDGELVFLPPRALGIQSRAAVAALPGTSFDEVREAPADTLAYSRDQPVSIEAGTVYVIRTREEPGSFGTRCVYYAKLEPIDIDPADGILTFVFDASPACNNRRLVPPR